jgi:hypothetical protein
MAIELSSLTFTNQDDIVPMSGVEEILNTGIANTLAGNDRITGTTKGNYGFKNEGTLNTDDGSDIITVTWGSYDNIGTLNMGEGDDVINAEGYVNAFANIGTLNMGEGNDIITGETVLGSGILITNGSTFDTGTGNDRIIGEGVNSDTIRSDGLSNYSFTFNTGDGNDTIDGRGYYGIYNKGFINTDNGKDIITATGGNYYGGRGISNFSTINTGSDDDIIIAAGGIENYGNIDIGDGNDIITSTANINNGIGSGNMGSAIVNSGTINTGEGKDIITSIATIYIAEQGLSVTGGGISNNGTINTGNNPDSIFSQGIFTNRGGVFLGEGNDSITTSSLAQVDLPNRALENFNVIETGDGDDTITTTGDIYNEGIINTGKGNDSIIVNVGVETTSITYSIYNNGGSINTGDGNDSLIANRVLLSDLKNSGSVFLGNGEDYLKGFGSGDFYGGNDEDTLELPSGIYTVGMWDTSATFTNGQLLMITSDFEKLIAGNTTYDFTSLTAGQIIIVA